MRRLLVLSTVVLAVLVGASSASAGIWSPVASGTTQDIAAVDYRASGDILYATSGGQILRNGVVQANFPGVQFTDIALNPAGDRGLATAANGKLYRYDGVSWTLVSLTNKTFNHTCGGVGPFPPATPSGNLSAATWAGPTTAYVVGDDRGMVLKVEGAGPPTVTDVSRKADGSCKADPGSGDRTTDIQAVTDQLIYLVTTDFGERMITADAFTSSAAHRNTSAVNCPFARSRIAVDLENASRSFVVGACSGRLSFGFSSDSATTYVLGLEYPKADEGNSLTGMNDVAVAGGAAMAVGNGGALVVSTDGRNGYIQRADGTEATTDWLAVDKLGAAGAAAGGRGGKLVVTTQATTIPDLVAPAGTISGPVSATAGQPTTYTANLADEAGGSGINPASITWSVAGLPGQAGNPVSLTFPSAGFFTVRVAFADNAGNPGTATLGVTVRAAPVVPPPGPLPVTPPATRTTTATVAGGKVTLAVPRACVPAGTSFTARLSFKRSKKKGSTFVKVASVDFFVDTRKQGKTDRKAPFTKRLTVKKLKAGSKHTLRARARIKVKKGKGPTKSISTSFKVCG